MSGFSEKTWRTVAERLIGEAIERGEFADLPGKGKPIPGIDASYHPCWWVKRKVRDEQIKVSPKRGIISEINLHNQQDSSGD